MMMAAAGPGHTVAAYALPVPGDSDDRDEGPLPPHFDEDNLGPPDAAASPGPCACGELQLDSEM